MFVSRVGGEDIVAQQQRGQFVRLSDLSGFSDFELWYGTRYLRPTLQVTTQTEMAARHSYACCLLERGVRVSSAVTMLQAKFGVARSSAYEDLKIAQAEIDASDDAPASDEPIVCPETLQAQLVHSLDKAFATDSFKEIQS